MVIAEIVPAFKGISDKLVPNARPALDCPVVFPYAPNAVPVSYTHLDVYKRQYQHHSWLFNCFGGTVWLWSQWYNGLLRKNAHDASEAYQNVILAQQHFTSGGTVAGRLLPIR